MKKFLIPALVGIGVLAVAAKAPKDPVLLTVDGDPVTLSEFEYFYHKNDGNEVEHETPEQYLQRFIDYKLKVAQAKAERQDTTASFRKDFRDYRRELAEPYMSDTKVYDQLVENAYKHTLKEVKIDHLMLPLDRPDLADSLHKALADGTADFYEVVKQFSIDPSAQQNGGRYDWIHAGEFPYEFEEIAFETPLNEISPVAKTNYGYHIVRPTAERPNIGEVHGAHILVKLDEGGDSAAAKARIDSIYARLEQGESFEILAKTLSDCPSKKNSGDLGFFNRGRMVPEFEEVIFGLENHSYSKPFLTRFGWHIAKKYESRKPSKSETTDMIKQLMKRDSRNVRPRLARAAQLRKEYNTRVEEAGREKLMSTVDAVGYDSARVVLAADPTPLIMVADSVITLGDFMATDYRLNKRQKESEQLAGRLDDRQNSATLVYEDHRLEQKYPEFRNLSREYSDGLMLVASLEKNVWNRPAEDPEGLDAYFKLNREKYAFPQPRWKGYVIYSTNDSLIGEIDNYLKTVNPAPAVLGDSLKANFPHSVRIERVVLPKGENQVIDYIAFGGPKPVFNNRWTSFTTYLGHLIDAPEEVADVRNRVTNDWTQELEQEFVKGLREKYPVKVNKKVLKKVK